MFPDTIAELLQDGYKVSFRATGHSMFPTIMANETIIVEPIEAGTVKLGDIILYRTHGRLIAHRVICIKKRVDPAYHHIHPNFEGCPLIVEFSASKGMQSPDEVLHFVLRGDASTTCDDPVRVEQILGKVVSIEREGGRVDPYRFSHQFSGKERQTEYG